MTCGCDDPTGIRLTTVHEHEHQHPHEDGAPTHTIVLEQRVLAKNDDLAEANRAAVRAHGTVLVNLMSSPGSGKTTLLERTIADLSAEWPVYVLEGDQETTMDADRIRVAGAQAVQVNTGAGCHLDADMVARGLLALAPTDGALVVVENVGNLVCPALFDLGEELRVVVMSTPEGDEKPLKYPHMFAPADVVVLTKTDLLPYVDFDVARLPAHLRAVNRRARLLPVSVRAGTGLAGWYGYLRTHRYASRPASGAVASP